MARVKLDKPIIDFVRRLANNRKFGDGTMSSIVEHAILFMASKHKECLACEFHKDQIAGLELGRQQMALSSYQTEQHAVSAGEWVVVGDDVLLKAKAIAAHYHRATKCLIEQAVLEHLTRPPNCASCPFYADMCCTVHNERLT